MNNQTISCSICHKTYRGISNIACAVLHSPEDCCHFGQVEVEPEKSEWEEEFDEIGFGNQARIVGSKRVELKDFIREEKRKSALEALLKVRGNLRIMTAHFPVDQEALTKIIDHLKEEYDGKEK